MVLVAVYLLNLIFDFVWFHDCKLRGFDDFWDVEGYTLDMNVMGFVGNWVAL